MLIATACLDCPGVCRCCRQSSLSLVGQETELREGGQQKPVLFPRAAAAAGGPAGASQPAPRVREGTLQQAVIRRAVAVATRSGAARVLAAQGPRAAIDQRAALGRKPKRRPRDVTASRVQPHEPAYSHAQADCCRNQLAELKLQARLLRTLTRPFAAPKRSAVPRSAFSDACIACSPSKFVRPLPHWTL